MSQDPFRDPNGSQRSSSIENRSSHTESTAPQEKIVVNSPQKSVPLSNQLATGGMGGIPPPQALLSTPTHGSNHHRQEPSRYTSQHQIEAIDHIAPIPRIGQIESQRSSYGGGTSSGDESTSSGLSERRPIPEPLDRRPEKIKSGHRWIVTTKWIFITTLISMNALFIFATWWWPKYYYIFLPLITITVALNCIMVFSVIFHVIFRKAIPEKLEIPAEPESMVLLLPCYNETYDELVKSLGSLVAQTGIDENKKAIMIICDGKVRGPGMEKTTADYLLEDILADSVSREYIPAAYTSWDHSEMDIVVQKGSYGGIPYICVIKQSNRGKRDGLILIRSFLYNFNIREAKPAVILSPYFFDLMVAFLIQAGFSKVDILIGMDADTFFEPICISELIKQSHYKHTVGVCGYVAVDFQGHNWSPWRLYQNAEYTISQCLRRLHQSIATHKVSCLPGCCQLLKVCETTCGDRVLLDKFGYHPTVTDNLLKQIRATASEDRNHVCLMLSTFPKARTRQALNARAYTDVPHSWSVFLSQRRRWTLGATSNDLFLVFAPGVMWFERILAIANVLTWVLNLFILACIASFIKACTFVHWTVILPFVAVMLLPLLYYILIVVWQPRSTKERVQYMLGLLLYFFIGPFLNVMVLVYALWSIDNFAWGKTRKVVEPIEGTDNEKSEVTAKKPSRNAQSGDLEAQ